MAEMAQEKKSTLRFPNPKHKVVDHSCRLFRPRFKRFTSQGAEAGFALSNQRIPEDAFDDSCWFKYHRERERESFHCHFFVYISSRPFKILE